MLNLFIGIIVNAMQEEHGKAKAEEREAERDLIHEETARLVREKGAQGRDRFVAGRAWGQKTPLTDLIFHARDG